MFVVWFVGFLVVVLGVLRLVRLVVVFVLYSGTRRYTLRF